MRHVYAEFLTTDGASPESYGDAGTKLDGLRQFPSVLRHTKYDADCWHEVQLFAREPELSAQVWFRVYPEPAGGPAIEQDLRQYGEQRSNFRLPSGVTFTPKALLPKAAPGFDIVPPFRVRDNRRLRVVAAFRGARRSVLLVASRDDCDFFTSTFLRATLDGLSLADTPLEAPYGER